MHPSAGSAQLQVLCDEWASCAGDWTKSKLLERMTASKSIRKHGARVWLTRAQIQAKYGNDPTIADQICKAKLDDSELRETHTKMHPDAPTVEAGMYIADAT